MFDFLAYMACLAQVFGVQRSARKGLKASELPAPLDYLMYV